MKIIFVKICKFDSTEIFYAVKRAGRDTNFLPLPDNNFTRLNFENYFRVKSAEGYKFMIIF
jgi:hypothetical protein